MTLRSVELAILLVFAMVGGSVWLVVRSVRRRSGGSARDSERFLCVGFSLLQGYGDRHRMWRAVSAAERAVAAAVAAEAASGDLPSLVRRLRRAAQSVDRLLDRSRLEHRSGRQVELRRVMDLAETIRTAATESLLTVTAPATSSLADAVATEVSALRHGLSVAALTRH